MGQVIHPRLYIRFTNTETQVITPFDNVVASFPYEADGADIRKANRFIEKWEKYIGQETRKEDV